ncbi:MAG TPA: NlpC/P60 family protein [Ktedonobacteraceae bacterium]|jgi:cell wall-associated NlpC family hydrolase|nr:NlpC/P60 family protein [Ktedonobacteraceae bacterium]
MKNLVNVLGLKQLGLLIGGIMIVGFLSQAVDQEAGQSQIASLQNIVAIAQAIEQGQAIEQAHWDGGIVSYAWGGGHGSTPGPSLGTCSGYTGPSPCRANQTDGLDCSGFVRWVYSIAFGSDVLNGSTYTMIDNPHLQQIDATTAVPGDLVFFGASAASVHHIGIYIGDGKMINALRTGTVVRTDPLLSDLFGYYHYTGTSNLLNGDPSNVSSSSVTATINSVFGPYAGEAMKIATCESGLNPHATNSTAVGGSHAEGVFQILYPSTWSTTSQAAVSPYNAYANIVAAHEIFTRDGNSWREWACKKVLQ